MIIIQKKQLFPSLLLLMLVSCLFFPLTALAVDEGGPTYFVKPLLTTNQKEDVTDFFHVKLKPEQKMALQLEIHNQTAEEMTFNTSVQDALTNENGIIDYQGNVKKYDESLIYKFTDIADVQKTIIVEAGSVKKLDINITMPKEPYDGIVLGGVRVSEKQPEDEEEQVGISNTFSYVIPVKLYETDQEIPNKLVFKGVTIGQQTFENVIKAQLQNPQPEILRDLEIEAKVFKKNGKEPVYEEKKDNMKLAPNSNFPYSISLGTDKFKAGKYRLELTAKAENLNETWKEEFEISGEEAKELNEGMVFKKATNWKLYGLIAALLLAVIVIGFLLYRQSKLKQLSKKKAEQKNMKKRKRVKKSTKKVMIFFLIFSGLSAGSLASAETASNSGVSDASIVIKVAPKDKEKEKEKENQNKGTNTNGKTISKNISRNTSGRVKKVLPQTADAHQKSQLLVTLGSMILLATASMLIIKRKKEKNYEL